MPFDLEVIEGTLSTLAEIVEVTTLDCPAPMVTLSPQIEPAPGVQAGAGSLWLEIREAGGWSTRLELGEIDWLGGVDIEPIALTPGTFQITAYIDDPPNGRLDDCDALTPDPWQARVEVDLDAENPDAQPILRLAPCEE